MSEESTAPAMSEVLLDQVRKARRPGDLFDGDPKEAKSTYRRLSKYLHPDQGGDPDLFAKVADLWRRYNGGAATSFEIVSKRRTYQADPSRYAGDIANFYPTQVERGYWLIKTPRSPKDSDLMQREAAALRAIAKADRHEWGRGMMPAILDSFRMRDKASRIERTCNVIEGFEGFYNLAEVKAITGPLNPLDAAWMARRVLAGLGCAHRAGFVHGAVVPEHVLIHPALHGVVLVDWCYSTPVGSKVPAVVPAYRDWYPPEVMDKEPAGPETDIYMFAKLFMWLTETGIMQYRAFYKGCTLRMKMRPNDAHELQREFDDLIERLHGPRKFRPFSMSGPTERV